MVGKGAGIDSKKVKGEKIKRVYDRPRDDWERRLKKMPVSLKSLKKVHTLYNANWRFLKANYMTAKGAMYKRREKLLNFKELYITKRLDKGVLENYYADISMSDFTYDDLLLSKLLSFSSNNYQKKDKFSLTEGNTYDILYSDCDMGE